MTATDLSWAAGLFEGEGSIRINKATRHNLGHLVASVTNTDREVVAFFQSRWPGYMKSVSGLRVDQRQAWRWVVASRRAASFIAAIRPFLQTRRVIEKADFGLSFQRQKTSAHAVCRSDEYREQQFNAYLWMKELNVRGATGRIER